MFENGFRFSNKSNIFSVKPMNKGLNLFDFLEGASLLAYKAFAFCDVDEWRAGRITSYFSCDDF